MLELPKKEIGKFIERLVEGVPGFAWTAILLNILLPQALPNTPPEWLPIVSIALAWASEKFGHYADDWLYDPFWGTAGWCRFPRKLAIVRCKLAVRWRVPVTGLFAKAAHLCKGTEIWEKRVKLWLEFSKTSRSFMFLSVAALLWLAWPSILILSFVLLIFLFVQMSKSWKGLKYWLSGATLIALLFRWTMGSAPSASLLPLAGMLFVSTGLYLGLRLLHNIRLYESAGTIEAGTRSGFLCVGQRVLPLRRVVLCFPGDGNDHLVPEAEAFVQSQALLHVELRAAYGSVQNWKPACNLNLDEKLERVDWGTNRQPIPVPPLNAEEWIQVSPDLVINFVHNSGVSLDNLIRRLNGAL